MALEVKLTPKLTYKLRLTPHMKLALNLLQLPMHELKEYIRQEIEKNPLLEPSENNPASSKERLDEVIKGTDSQEFGKYESDISWTEEDEEKKQYRDSLISESPTLENHLTKQLRLFSKSKGDFEIGEFIISNINENGYLTSSIEEMAKTIKVNVSKVEEVLLLIQTFDPVGIGARDLRECLLLQLRAKREENSLAGKIADTYLPFLEKKRYGYIVKRLKVSVEEIKEAIKELARLEPKPGRAFSAERAVRLIPDALLEKNKDGYYKVISNDSELPRISLNAKYKEMLKKEDTPKEVKEYLKERLKAGHFLIDAVNKRKETIRNIIEEIVYIQKDFLDNGTTHCKPLTLSQIANRIGKHKSTVSRAIANKYLQTPYGIVELRYFLSSGVKQENGILCSSKNIKLKISKLIKNEDKNKPLADQDIANLFKQDGVSVSRRTIAKYRHQLKILPSKSRRG